MSELKCETVSIKVKPHPNADAIELGKVGDYLSIIRKDSFKTGDKVVYIPEQSILPNTLIEEMGLTGRLAGKDQNRVKAIKLRGILSQGLIYPAKPEWEIGQDVREELNIVKWEPPIPTTLAGQVDSVNYQLKLDPENIKKYPNIFEEGEEVYITEKIHGTFCSLTLLSKDLRKENMLDGKFAVSSKTLAQGGLYFKDVPDNENNGYLRAIKKTKVHLLLEELDLKQPFSLVGEVFGKVQDLKYGFAGDVSFRAFGLKTEGKFLNFGDFYHLCRMIGIPTVPLLYQGPFFKDVVEKFTSGKEQVSGNEVNIREGVVIYPAQERHHDEIGRVFLKSISEKYLLRKSGTEFN